MFKITASEKQYILNRRKALASIIEIMRSKKLDDLVKKLHIKPNFHFKKGISFLPKDYTMEQRSFFSKEHNKPILIGTETHDKKPAYVIMYWDNDKKTYIRSRLYAARYVDTNTYYWFVRNNQLIGGASLPITKSGKDLTIYIEYIEVFKPFRKQGIADTFYTWLLNYSLKKVGKIRDLSTVIIRASFESKYAERLTRRYVKNLRFKLPLDIKIILKFSRLTRQD